MEHACSELTRAFIFSSSSCSREMRCLWCPAVGIVECRVSSLLLLLLLVSSAVLSSPLPMDWREEQSLEVEALQSIYADEFTEISDEPRSYRITLEPVAGAGEEENHGAHEQPNTNHTTNHKPQTPQDQSSTRMQRSLFAAHVAQTMATNTIWPYACGFMIVAGMQRILYLYL